MKEKCFMLNRDLELEKKKKGKLLKAVMSFFTSEQT